MKRILFPFFNREKHGFLTNKWWFRTIVVIYIIIFILSIPCLWIGQVNGVYNDCKNDALMYWGNGTVPSATPGSLDDFNGYYDSLHNCNELAREWWTMGLAPSIIIPIVLFYLLQLIFFKIIINYIVLGGKK